jgi:hypothetical protein
LVQVIHARDVARAVGLALRPGVAGIFNLKGPGEAPLSRIFRILGKPPMPVLPDPPAAVRAALTEPLGLPPLAAFARGHHQARPNLVHLLAQQGVVQVVGVFVNFAHDAVTDAALRHQ